MSQHTTHTQCYQVLDAVLRAFEAGGYTRLVASPQVAVMFDGNPAPGYVPGALGKKDTGIDYVPNGDGTRVHLYYGAFTEPSETAKAEADAAVGMGYDKNELIGSLVSIKRTKDGGILLQILASNRIPMANGAFVMGKKSLRTISIKANPASGGGVLAALALDQMLGIPYHMLKALLESERARARTPLTDSVRARRDGALGNTTEQTPRAQGATGEGEGVAQ